MLQSHIIIIRIHSPLVSNANLIVCFQKFRSSADIVKMQSHRNH